MNLNLNPKKPDMESSNIKSTGENIPYLLMASGLEFRLQFDANDCFSDRLGIEDVAHHLSQINRFNGATYQPYSVAQHSLICSRMVPSPFQLPALLHDANEVILGDTTTPLKQWLGGESIMEIEDMIQNQVYAMFGLEEDLHKHWIVREADLVLLETEYRDLLPASGMWEHHEGIRPMTNTIKPIPANMAKELFIQRFHQLATRTRLAEDKAARQEVIADV